MKKLFSILLVTILLLTVIDSNLLQTARAETNTHNTNPGQSDSDMENIVYFNIEEQEYEILPEEYRTPEQRIAGDWYASYSGLLVTLCLSEDGSYTISDPVSDTVMGKWTLEKGLLVLDGNTETPLQVGSNALRQEDADILFTRRLPETYVPAGVYAGAIPGDLDGYWKAKLVSAGSGTILASVLEENTEVYIEGSNIALGGNRFGQIIRTGTFDNGALTLDEAGAKLTLQLQLDGFLRLTIDGKDGAILYLMPALIPGAQQP